MFFQVLVRIHLVFYSTLEYTLTILLFLGCHCVPRIGLTTGTVLIGEVFLGLVGSQPPSYDCRAGVCVSVRRTYIHRSTVSYHAVSIQSYLYPWNHRMVTPCHMKNVPLVDMLLDPFVVHSSTAGSILILCHFYRYCVVYLIILPRKSTTILHLCILLQYSTISNEQTHDQLYLPTTEWNKKTKATIQLQQQSREITRMPPKKQNSKQVAGNARKADQQAVKSQQQIQQEEALTAKEWQQGADQRGQSRSDAAATKEAEAAKKRADKANLLAEEDQAMDSIKTKKPAVQPKKKNKNDLGLLDGFVTEAEKAAKAKKKAEIIKKEKEAALLAQKQAAKEAIVIDPLFLNTEAMLATAIGRVANKQSMEDSAMSGIDGALDHLQINKQGGGEIKSQKALYLAYEERTMPLVKADYPGLRLTQYKEKIFAMWKKSPENPQNNPLPEK